MCFFHSLYPSQYKDEVNRLTDELYQIGKADDFLSVHPGGYFDQNCRHVRAREIGTRFMEIGGIPLMEKTVKKVSKKNGKDIGAHLESCWTRIGNF